MMFKPADDEEMKTYLNSPETKTFLESKGITWNKEQIENFADSFDCDFSAFVDATCQEPIMDLDSNF